MMIAVWLATEDRNARTEPFHDIESLEYIVPKDWPSYVMVPTVIDRVFEVGYPEVAMGENGVLCYSLRLK